MIDSVLKKDYPKLYNNLLNESDKIGFTMPSDIYIGSLLKTLIASKPNSTILELGTGIGLSLSWMVGGMDEHSKITSIDNDAKLTEIAKTYFGNDDRVRIVCADGSEWIKSYSGPRFDLIFADAWPGKYSEIEEILMLLKIGGYYVIDDMSPQTNWPSGHDKKAKTLIEYLQHRTDLVLTKMNWSTGIIVAVKNG